MPTWSSRQVRVQSNMQQSFIQSKRRVRVGPQVAVILIVLLAVFALPCCPRIDGWLAVAETRVTTATPIDSTSADAHHGSHHHQVTGEEVEGVHKGHLATTGAVDVLPGISLFVLGALIPLATSVNERVARLTLGKVPRIPVPPPRVAT